MKHRRNVPIPFMVWVLCLISIATPAYGYIDPNAAGLASQILTPLLVVAAAGVAFLRKQIGPAFGALAPRLQRRANA